jgi:Outer membrane protein beta-barrel domain
MKTSLLLLALAVLGGNAVAGTMAAPQPMAAPMAPASELFGAGWHVGAHGLFLTPDADRADDTWGGGVNLDYFVSPFVGFQASASWADPGTDEIWHNYTLDLVLRAPIESAHIAPYIFIGGGAILEDDADILGRAGVGLEYRPTASFGIFADWIYNFPGGGGGDDDVEDYQMIRAGVKFGF